MLEANRARAARRLAILAAGALSFYIPFAVFFAVPDFEPIRTMLNAANATGGGLQASISSQFLQLSGWVRRNWPFEFPLLGRMAFFPFDHFRIPPLALAVPILALSRSLRGLAFPGAILPLF